MRELSPNSSTLTDINVILPKEEIFPLERHARLANIPIMYASWGRRITAAMYKEQLRSRNELTPVIERMIDSSGFKVNWRLDDDANLLSEEVQAQHIQYGVALAQRVIKARGWKGVSALGFASLSSKDYVPFEIVKELKKRGIAVESIVEYVTACFGGFAPVIDFSRADSPYLGEQVATVALESLSGNVMDPKNHTVWWMFGNGGGSTAWVPGKEIQVIYGRNEIEPDSKGAIKVVRNYTIPEEERIYELPPGYAFAENIPEQDKRLFYQRRSTFEGIDHRVIYMQMVESPTNKVTLDPDGALHAFGEPVVTLSEQVDQEYNQNYAAEFGPLNEVGLSHMASLQMKWYQLKLRVRQKLTRDYNLPMKIISKYLKMPEVEQVKFLKDLGINDFKPPQLHWTLDDMPNISAPTIFVDAVTKFSNHLIPINKVFPVQIYGIGVMRGHHEIIVKA